MGRSPAYVKKNYDRITERRPGGKNFNTGWGDLVVMFNALNDPASSAAYLDAHPHCLIEGGNTYAFMYHWIHTLDQLGINDAGVVADYPFSNVFQKDGRKTYAVYNYGPSPLTVHFSDGWNLLAKPKSLTVNRSDR